MECKHCGIELSESEARSNQVPVQSRSRTIALINLCDSCLDDIFQDSRHVRSIDVFAELEQSWMSSCTAIPKEFH